MGAEDRDGRDQREGAWWMSYRFGTILQGDLSTRPWTTALVCTAEIDREPDDDPPGPRRGRWYEVPELEPDFEIGKYGAGSVRLAWAILTQAVDDYVGTEKEHEEAARWIFCTEKSHWPFAFDELCRVFRIDADETRQYLRKTFPERKRVRLRVSREVRSEKKPKPKRQHARPQDPSAASVLNFPPVAKHEYWAIELRRIASLMGFPLWCIEQAVTAMALTQYGPSITLDDGIYELARTFGRQTGNRFADATLEKLQGQARALRDLEERRMAP
jgi:hypothetical protein